MLKRFFYAFFICVFLFGINGVGLTSDNYIMRVEKIKYTLNGEEIIKDLETPVEVTIYEDHINQTPVKLYDFPNAVEGTITKIDLYATYIEDGEVSGPIWWTDFFAEGHWANADSNKVFAIQPIPVTQQTDRIYVGWGYTDNIDRFANPSATDK
jgi:hypothetical protein